MDGGRTLFCSPSLVAQTDIDTKHLRRTQEVTHMHDRRIFFLSFHNTDRTRPSAERLVWNGRFFFCLFNFVNTGANSLRIDVFLSKHSAKQLVFSLAHFAINCWKCFRLAFSSSQFYGLLSLNICIVYLSYRINRRVGAVTGSRERVTKLFNRLSSRNQSGSDRRRRRWWSPGEQLA